MSALGRPACVDDRVAARRVRETFDRLGYTTTGILDTIGATDGEALTAKDPQVVWYRTRDCRPLDLLIRMFLLGMPVGRASVSDALGTTTLAEWHELGLLTIEGDAVASTVEALPYENLLLVFDFDRRVGGKLRSDYVMGIGRSTITLATITIRRPIRRMLDLGTGCGTHAFLAARHSDHAIGVDRNPRAVDLARFNAALNGLDNVEFVEGDMFAPVAGQCFDLVVSNPPFVISPASRFLYRDGGMSGDRLCRSIVRAVPEFLNEGGYCQMLCNWATVAGEDWRTRLEEWTHNIGCDAWVMRSETRDPAVYAATWIQHTESGDPTYMTKCFNEWMAYYEREHIEAMSAGIILLRRRSAGSNWFRADDGPEKMLGQSGADVLQLFALRDFLETAGHDDALLAQSLELSPYARLTRQCEPSADGWRPIRHELRLVRGLGYVGGVDAYLAALLEGCDGHHPLRDLIANLASDLRADFQAVAGEVLTLTRELIARGFLRPSANSPEGQVEGIDRSR